MSAVTAKVIGSTIRNTAEMLPTGTGKRRINSEVKVLVAQAALVIDQAAQQEVARVPGVAGSQEEEQQEIARVVVEQGIAPVVAEQGIAPVAVERGIARVAVEQGIVPVVAEPGIVPVAVELEHDQAVAELEVVPVEVELEHDQGEAELELVRAAGLLRIKSVIAALHRGPAPVLGAEDLAAEVQTTREPAAAEGAVAWEVAE